ncbi:unnamed protein product [Cuscuta campestris]|uniref:Legume lectin domain-containing protein n=1 Tax=Cuscuta campestris TaxID=132261 RepID=A0A484NHH1_9ASTE|nr:unnamed protein product [Cuscuta campestris]
MATSSPIWFLAVAFGLLAVSAAARPCKTLFFFSSTSLYPVTSSVSQVSNLYPNFRPENPKSLTFFFTSARIPYDDWKFLPARPAFVFRDPFSGVEEQVEETVPEDVPQRLSSSASMNPIELYSSVSSSIRDRTKDIMSVVGALLFGLGCGALTAATMYLIWSLFWPQGFDFEDSDDEFDDDDIAAQKKAGYVAIPAKVVDDDLQEPALPTKEVV